MNCDDEKSQVQNLSKILGYLECLKHKKQQEFYCLTCNQAICAGCIKTKQHPMHNLIGIEEAPQHLSQIAAQAKEHLRDTLYSYVEGLSDFELQNRKTQKMCTDFVNQVENMYKKVLNEMESIKMKLLIEVLRICAEQERCNEKLQADLQERQVCARQLHQMLARDELLPPESLIHHGRQIGSAVQAAQEIQAPQIPNFSADNLRVHELLNQMACCVAACFLKMKANLTEILQALQGMKYQSTTNMHARSKLLRSIQISYEYPPILSNAWHCIQGNRSLDGNLITNITEIDESYFCACASDATLYFLRGNHQGFDIISKKASGVGAIFFLLNYLCKERDYAVCLVGRSYSGNQLPSELVHNPPTGPLQLALLSPLSKWASQDITKYSVLEMYSGDHVAFNASTGLFINSAGLVLLHSWNLYTDPITGQTIRTDSINEFILSGNSIALKRRFNLRGSCLVLANNAHLQLLLAIMDGRTIVVLDEDYNILSNIAITPFRNPCKTILLDNGLIISAYPIEGPSPSLVTSSKSQIAVRVYSMAGKRLAISGPIESSNCSWSFSTRLEDPTICIPTAQITPALSMPGNSEWKLQIKCAHIDAVGRLALSSINFTCTQPFPPMSWRLEASRDMKQPASLHASHERRAGGGASSCSTAAPSLQPLAHIERTPIKRQRLDETS